MKQDPRLSRTPLIDASVFVCLTPVKWMRLGKKTGSEFLTPKKVLLHQVRMSFFPSRDRCVKSEFYCALSTCTIKRPSESTHASDVYPTMTTTRGRFEFFSFVRERERVNWAGSDRAMNDRFSFIRNTLLFFVSPGRRTRQRRIVRRGSRAGLVLMRPELFQLLLLDANRYSRARSPRANDRNK